MRLNQWLDILVGKDERYAHAVWQPNFRPSLWRLLKFDKNLRHRLAVPFFRALGLTVFCCLLVWICWFEVDGSHYMGFAFQAAFYGSLLIVVIRSILFSIRLEHRYISAGALIPGIVVSLEPLRIVCYANMSNRLGIEIPALKMIDGGTVASNTFSQHDVIPCVANFLDVDLPDRWGDFMPRPLFWASDDTKALAENKARLESDGIANLEKWLKMGLIPEFDDEILWC